MKPEPSSFRDPAGRVFESSGRIFRAVSAAAAEEYRFVRKHFAFDPLIEAGAVVDAVEVDPALLGEHAPAGGIALEHPALPFISYPYEWPFALLRAAALQHLDLQLELLDHGITLSDASAYNLQFDGAQPVFIDWLSFRRYRQGEYWLAHRQFCEQFLNPLLLRAELGVPHNAWYRGEQEGIRGEHLARLLPLHRRFGSLRMQTHLYLPLRLQARSGGVEQAARRVRRAGGLPLAAFRGLLTQLRRWISGLRAAEGKTLWSEYESGASYDESEARAKHALVRDFARETKPALLLDLGCNTGEFSEAALAAGASFVVGLDADFGALERASARAQAAGLRFLPLYQDVANPTPGQGFQSSERRSLAERSRGRADALLALALLHHLVIGRNLPLARVLDWLLTLAPRGLIEFVPREDRRVQQLLALREDIFPDYHAGRFEALLRQRAAVSRIETISASGRRIYWYDTRRVGSPS